jgi:hypothetical protein
MPFKRKKDLDFDADYKVPPAPKRLSKEAEEELFFQTSSTPTFPHLGRSWSLASSEDEEMDEVTPLLDIMVRLMGSLPTLEPSTSAACTPRKQNDAARTGAALTRQRTRWL